MARLAEAATDLLEAARDRSTPLTADRVAALAGRIAELADYTGQVGGLGGESADPLEALASRVSQWDELEGKSYLRSLQDLQVCKIADHMRVPTSWVRANMSPYEIREWHDYQVYQGEKRQERQERRERRN